MSVPKCRHLSRKTMSKIEIGTDSQNKQLNVSNLMEKNQRTKFYPNK